MNEGETGKPDQDDIYNVIQKRYYESYDDDPAWRKTVEDAKGVILAEKPDIKVSLPFIIYILGNPQIAAQFPTASLKTKEAFERSLKTRRGSDVLETVFFIDEENGDIFANEALQKPAAYDLPVPEIQAVRAPERQVIAMFHTHPPIGEILKPSVYIQHNGQESGDLLAFTKARELRSKAIADGEYPPYVERPLSIIMQSDIEKGTEKFLFILESEELAALSKDQYLDRLKENNESINNASSEEEIVRILREIGYRASKIEIKTDDLFNSYPIMGNELKKLFYDLDLIPH